MPNVFPVKHVRLLRWSHGWIIWSLLKTTFTFLTQCEKYSTWFNLGELACMNLLIRDYSKRQPVSWINTEIPTVTVVTWILFLVNHIQSLCVRLSACRSSDSRARPSACPVRLACCISLRRSTDRHACPSACPIWLACRITLRRSTDRHARPSACPVQLACRISLRRSTDRLARPSSCPIWLACRVSLCHSADWLHAIYVFLLLTYGFSHSHETLTLTLLLQ
jgi:hypothetical protein